jgi:hypothetical protein
MTEGLPSSRLISVPGVGLGLKNEIGVRAAAHNSGYVIIAGFSVSGMYYL